MTDIEAGVPLDSISTRHGNSDGEQLDGGNSVASEPEEANSTVNAEDVEPIDWFKDQFDEICNVVSRFDKGTSMPRRGSKTVTTEYWPLKKIFKVGKKPSWISQTFESGPSRLRCWMQDIFYGRKRHGIEPYLDKLHFTWTQGADGQVNKYLLSTKLPKTRSNIVHINDKTKNCRNMVILLPNLTQVGAKLLMEQYNIDHQVLEGHLGHTFPHDTGHSSLNLEISDRSLDIEGGTYTVALACEGDFWSQLTDCVLDQEGGTRWCRAFSEQIEWAFGEHARPWPLGIAMSNMLDDEGKCKTRFRRGAAELRVKSQLTIHAFMDGPNRKKGKIQREQGLQQTRCPDGSMLFDAYYITECGFSTGTWSRAAHLDGEPLMNADRCILSGLNDAETDLHYYEAKYEQLGDELLNILTVSSEINSQAIVTDIMSHLWPCFRRAIETTLERDTRRLENFKLMRSKSDKFIQVEEHNSFRSEETWLNAIEFLQDRIESQFKTLDCFERHLNMDLKKKTTQEKETDCGLVAAIEDIRSLKIICQGLENACAQQKQLCTMREQRILTQKQLEETQKSIQQNDLIRKLTMLAFFFIPISAVTSAFGMNLAEISNNQPSVGIFVAAVCSVTGISVLLAILPALLELDAGMLQVLQSMPYRYFLRISMLFIWPLHNVGLLDAGRIIAFHRPLPDFIASIAVFTYKYILTGVPRIVVGLLYICLNSIKVVRAEGRRSMQDSQRRP